MRFAALAAATPATDVEILCRRLRVPGRFSELAVLGARLQPRVADAVEHGAEALLDLLEAADALRRPERFERLLLALGRARLPRADTLALLRSRLAVGRRRRARSRSDAGPGGPAIAAALRNERLARLRQLPQIQSVRRRS